MIGESTKGVITALSEVNHQSITQGRKGGERRGRGEKGEGKSSTWGRREEVRRGGGKRGKREGGRTLNPWIKHNSKVLCILGSFWVLMQHR